MTQIIDGKAVAAKVRDGVREEVAKFKQKTGVGGARRILPHQFDHKAAAVGSHQARLIGAGSSLIAGNGADIVECHVGRVTDAEPIFTK